MARDRDIAAFDARAPGYESGWRGRLHHQIADRTAELALTLTPAPRRILDAGCGTGYLLRQLAVRCPNAELAGIDPAPAMIEAALKSLCDAGPAIRGAVSLLPPLRNLLARPLAPAVAYPATAS